MTARSRLTTVLILLAPLAAGPSAFAQQEPVPQAVRDAMQYRERTTRWQEQFLAEIGQRVAALEQRTAGPGIPAEVATATRALRPELQQLRSERDDRAFAARANLLNEKVAAIEYAFGG